MNKALGTIFHQGSKPYEYKQTKSLTYHTNYAESYIVKVIRAVRGLDQTPRVRSGRVGSAGRTRPDPTCEIKKSPDPTRTDPRDSS